MKIIIINPILYTADNNIIPKVKSIKDTMIYNMCLGFKSLGHEVTLAAAIDYQPVEVEKYEFEVKWLKTVYHKLCPPSVLPYSNEFSTFLKKTVLVLIWLSQVKYSLCGRLLLHEFVQKKL